MAERQPFQYAIIRVCPRVERGECYNAGIVVFSRPLEFLAARTALRPDVLELLAPGIDQALVQSHLDAVERVAAGEPGAGAMAQLSQSERFHWLVAPSSTMIQASSAHTGLCDDAAAQLNHLFRTLVEDQP